MNELQKIEFQKSLQKIKDRKQLEYFKNELIRVLESTENKPFICLTTDLFPMYRNVADELGVKHQLCIFHLFKTINHKIKTYCRKNKLNKNEKQVIYNNTEKLKNCFTNIKKEEIMSYADKVFIDMCRDIIDNGVSTEGEKVRPKWEDGTPAHTVKKFCIVNRYDLQKEFPIMTIRKQYLKSAIDEYYNEK